MNKLCLPFYYNVCHFPLHNVFKTNFIFLYYVFFVHRNAWVYISQNFLMSLLCTSAFQDVFWSLFLQEVSLCQLMCDAKLWYTLHFVAASCSHKVQVCITVRHEIVWLISTSVLKGTAVSIFCICDGGSSSY